MNELYIRGLRVETDKLERGSYVREIPALRDLTELHFDGAVTCFVGENGTGKSTLLEAIAVAYGFNPEGGTLNYHFSTYDDVSPLAQALTLVKGFRRPKTSHFFRAESFFNVASKAEEYREYDTKEVYYARYGGKSLHEQSHGESFLAFFQSFREPGLYLMDEPEAALSPQRQLTLLSHLAYLAGKGAQIILATHSPILLGLPDAALLSFDGEAIHPVQYEETESYRITELFINHRRALLGSLLEGE